MSMNRIQIQPGLSMPEFLKQFGTEVQCESELEQARWPLKRSVRAWSVAYNIVSEYLMNENLL